MKQIFILLSCLGIVVFNSFQCTQVKAKEVNKVESHKAEQKMNLSEDTFIELVIKSMQTELELIEAIQDRKEWFISYREIIDKYDWIIDPPETIYDYYTYDEINLILRCIETETYQSDFLSKVNVANVILNRIESGLFGSTVYDVITEKNQFAYGRENISEDTILALEYAFEIEDTTQGSIGFHSNAPTSTFNGWEYIFTDDAGHSFYRLSNK